MSTRVRLAILVLIVALGVAVFFVFQGREPSGPATPDAGVSAAWEPSTATFSTWDEFLSGEQWQSHARGGVVFIGVDGATWNVIEPLVAEGALPTFERLMNEGTWGTLRSVDCFVSPPAWTTMMTGCLPEKSGIYTFGQWKRDERTFMPISAEDILVPSAWDIASLAGKRTAVTNVPMTYPVRAVNGIMVGGFLVPARIADRRVSDVDFATAAISTEGLPRSFSPVLWSSLIDVTNQYVFALCDTRDDGITEYDTVTLRLERTEAAPDERVQMMSFAVNDYSPWLKIDYTDDGDSQPGWCKILLRPARGSRYTLLFSHVLFSAGESDVHFTYPDSLVDELVARFGYYFPTTHLDAGILEDFADDASRFASFFYDYDDWDLFLYVFNQTDNAQHLTGNSETTRRVYQRIDRHLSELLELLPETSTLIVASDHGGQGYEWVVDLNKVLEGIGLLTYDGDGGIDYDQTIVFHNLWCVYFNDSLLTAEELTRRGVPVADGVSPREALIAHLEAAGRDLAQKNSQRPFPLEFSRVPAGAAGYAPDLVVRGGYPTYRVEFWNFERPQPTAIHRETNTGWDHRRDGMYIVYGHGARRGVHGPVSQIQDIAPTMLYLLNLPLPPHIDGTIMTGALDPAQLAATPLITIENFGEIPTDAIVSEEQRESLEKKLRSLGYIR